MRSGSRVSLIAAVVLCCAQLGGCASMKPAPAPALTLEQVERIGNEAERALAANDLPAAGRGFARIVMAYPDHAAAWYRLGTIYLRTSQHHAAQQAFEHSLRAAPHVTKAYANLAIAHLGQFRSAAARALQSEQVSENNRLALSGLLQDVNQALPPAPGQ